MQFAAIEQLELNKAYDLRFECRDIGYGVEEGEGEYVYRGLYDSWGKYEFTPVGGGNTIYLFPDEIVSAD